MSGFPVRIGSAKEFAALRNLLARAGYDEPAVCDRLGIEGISKFELIQPDRDIDPDLPDGVAVLARLFLEALFVDGNTIRSRLGEDAVRHLVALGLIGPHPTQPDVWYGTTLLYPMRGLHIISDRSTNPDGSPFQPLQDIVYPAIIPNTELFLGLLPDTPCDEFLDLCGGSGVAGLMMARRARHTWSVDIAERSTHFAEFNRHLNGIENMSVGTGDLYAPVEGKTFDCIAVHPPYVPDLKETWIFSSGGSDGEQVTRRIIQGLPDYLRPGGRFYCLAMATDREQPLEVRVREWLGDRQAQFDIAFITRRTLDPEEYAARSIIKRKGTAEEVHKWQGMFRDLKVRNLVYGFIMIGRHAKPKRNFTVRRQRCPKEEAGEHHWLMEWETQASQPDGLKRLLAQRLVTAPGTELRVLNRLSGGDWDPVSYTLQTEYPFNMETEAQAWVPYPLTRCDGTRTAMEHLDDLKRDGVLHPGTTLEQYGDAVRLLISGGFLEVEGLRHPQNRNSAASR